jgi:peptidoglycan/LPS O-acetylase OafA/YrhL
MRVFPIYYLMLAVLLLSVPRIHVFDRVNDFWITRGSAFPYWAYLSNWPQLDTGVHRFLCVCWSLAIEEQYYVVWPLITLICSSRTLGAVSLLLLLGSIASRTSFFLWGVFTGWQLYHMTFTHLDGIVLGSAVAVAWADRDRFGAALRTLTRAAPILGVCLLGVVLWAGMTRSPGADLAYTPSMVLCYWLISAFYASLLTRSLEPRGFVRSLFSSRFLRLLGKYSYAAYLFQFLAAWLVDVAIKYAHARFLFVPGMTSPAGLFVKFAAQVAATYAMAAVSWVFLEGPINAYKDRAPALKIRPRRAPEGVLRRSWRAVFETLFA